MPAKTLTLEEFLQMPETKPANEYACGEVYQKPMPTGPHSTLQLYFGLLLYPFTQSRLGRVFPELRCIFGLPDNVRTYVPDVVFVRAEHLPVRRHLLTAPDLAIEVISPEQSWPQMLSKIQFYLLNGVRLVWVADPETRTITVEAPGQEARILKAGDTLDGGDVIPGFSVEVSEIFAQLDD
jgi:Uma2 family endonuclease